MKTGYVIYRENSNTHQEVYVDAIQRPRSNVVESTDTVEDAMFFDTAAEAYEWAQERGLEWWRVGAR